MERIIRDYPFLFFWRLCRRLFPFLGVAAIFIGAGRKKAAAVSDSSLLVHRFTMRAAICSDLAVLSSYSAPASGFTAAQSGAHSPKRKSPHCCIICARALNISERR